MSDIVELKNNLKPRMALQVANPSSSSTNTNRTSNTVKLERTAPKNNTVSSSSIDSKHTQLPATSKTTNTPGPQIAKEAIKPQSQQSTKPATKAEVKQAGQQEIKSTSIPQVAEKPADLYAAQGPYNPQSMREMLTQKHPGADISSSTLPLPNQKNVRLAGQRHLTTGIVFDQKGFPIFDDVVKFDTKIGREFTVVKEIKTHMKAATRDLHQQIKAGKIDSNGFNPQQLQAIQQGSDQIPGFTWHHHQDIGRMQLIPKSAHTETGHVGGMSIWFQK